MVDVSEVVVRATPKGIANTTDEIDEMEDSIAESTDEMDKQADAMGDLSKRFSGAMTTVMAGLAIATAGLLSQVPVIGETMGALGAILDSVIFRLDNQLRPVLVPIADRLFGLSEAIFEADGAFGMLVDGVILAFSALGLVAGAALTATKVLAPFIGALITVAKVALPVAKGIAAVIAGIISLPVLIAAAIASLAVLAFVFRDELWDAIQTAIGILGKLASVGATLVSAFVSKTVDTLRGWIGQAANIAQGVVTAIATRLTSLAERAGQWGRDVINRFIDGIRAAVGRLKDVLGNLRDIGANVGIDVPSLDIGGGGGSSGGNGGDSGFIGSVGGGSPSINIDGRSLDDNQGRFRKDSLTRRGG